MVGYGSGGGGDGGGGGGGAAQSGYRNIDVQCIRDATFWVYEALQTSFLIGYLCPAS